MGRKSRDKKERRHPPEIPEGMQPLGVRLAIRTEGTLVVAYFAGLESMEGAVRIATISRQVLEEDGGRDGPLFQAWHDALATWVNRIASHATGIPLETFKSIDCAPPADA